MAENMTTLFKQIWQAILYLRCITFHQTVQNGTQGIICKTCNREYNV